LQPAIRTGSLDQGQRATTCGARIAAEIDLMAIDELVPVVLEQLGELRQFGLLDQEVRLGPSTFAGGAGWTPDLRCDAGRDAAIAEALHVGDRARHCRHQLDHIDLASLGPELEPGSSPVIS